MNGLAEWKSPPEKRVLVAMSGGVDSAVAACLMKERGFDCMGVTLRLFDNEEAGLPREKTCCSLSDTLDARSIALKLGIPYYVFNFKTDFYNQVIRRFITGYENGLTPNPCIDCNRYIKFGKLYSRALLLGCGYFVTGHYARIVKSGDRFLLKKAADEAKDQSYVLYSMTEEQLSHTFFPLGELKKSEVRVLAEKWGLCNARKKDSQDLCFAPDGDYAAALERLSGKKAESGSFVDNRNRILGTHRGLTHYTVGQRRGLGISSSTPLFVCGKDPETNTVRLGQKAELYAASFFAKEANILEEEALTDGRLLKVKVRYHAPEQPARIFWTGKTSFRVVFDEKQCAITPGQAAVIYDGDTVVGGGTIAWVGE